MPKIEETGRSEGSEAAEQNRQLFWLAVVPAVCSGLVAAGILPFVCRWFYLELTAPSEDASELGRLFAAMVFFPVLLTILSSGVVLFWLGRNAWRRKRMPSVN